MNREKIFNIFVFLSTLARSLIDCFIPIILYEKGLDIEYIILFLLLNYSLCFLLNVPLGYLGKKLTFKWAMIVTSFFIAISYYYLLMTNLTIVTLFLFAICHVIHTHVYWLARHYYAISILPKKDMADEVGNIIIFSTLAIIPVSYFGAILMNNLAPQIVLMIVVFLYMVSVVPLFKMVERKKDSKISVTSSAWDIAMDAPKKSLLFMVLAQFKTISRYLFPLVIFLYIKDNYEYIGIFNIAVGVASMFFVYFFSRKMDRDKKDYLVLSGVLGCVVYLLKMNITDTGLMLLIGLFEGLVEKMYDLAFNRNLYALGHHYEGFGYPVLMEGIQNMSRIIIILFFVIFSVDLKAIIYISAFMLIVTGLVGFDDGKGGY